MATDGKSSGVLKQELADARQIVDENSTKRISQEQEKQMKANLETASGLGIITGHAAKFVRDRIFKPRDPGENQA